jgi:predicted ester cyclase
MAEDIKAVDTKPVATKPIVGTPAVDLKTVVTNTFNVINTRNLTALKTSVAPKFQTVFADVATRAHAAFPNMKLTVDDVITEGDKVVTRWTMTGTHTGLARQSQMGEVKPTGKPVKVQGITIHQVENGVIVNTWGATGKLEALVQLGLLGAYAKAVGQ